MKVLKCCVLSLLTVIAIMSFNINPAVAAEKTDELKVVKKNKEITDPAKLLERAKKHILDDTDRKKSQQKNASFSTQSVDFKNNQKTYETSQLLESKTNNKGEKIETYNFTTLAVTDGSGSYSDERWDSTHGAKAYQTVKYQKYRGSGGRIYYKLTKVSGGWKISDWHYTASGMKVGFAAIGITESHGVINKAQYKYPKSLTYSYSPPSWYPIAKTPAGASKFGATAYIKLHKSGSKTWTLFLNNLMW
ncbi:hypothetical protein P5667_00075 (plasmid) [Bacillus velezensis]|nr:MULTISPECIES: hypothetical protein [Bacillus amyloliquefaciens group]SLC78278.1 Uncharacterised protein [Mycobacteroides abscessus subsp. massiliense]HEO2443952.1 hypothetical protein [Streptococcus agalactiae]ALV04500.1 hypothetical protein AVM03_19245 [Bacillus amyloliquefaciens]ALV04505.1 hypothetical protein AVM03_19270 [Bacillus amyloliquefaciens]MDH3084390.1 hypothetical protein [Bacillus velezensis]